VYSPTDHLVRGPWGAGIAWQAIRAMEACDGVRNAGRLPVNSQFPRLARQAIDKHIYFAVVSRASAYFFYVRNV